ncbi:hypothetical protein OHB35_51860 [Streptomyces phaeochromogenes]|uniref:Catechol dioxygenase N-terminal domain-containing protein n=1 Tax=Streptomyces phaeochromogenes TaxID=1923 RepID=A0ABZ1HR36_STRPH|nr:dioxygenase [Streptomyces phaeochromogenes]WSD21067.1 hypothetical protein OHB35_51860 [Streptomyces phaeochromogenes]
MIIHDEHHLTAAVLAESERDGARRVREIIQALVRHLPDFAREVRPAEEECDTALGIMTRLGRLTTPSHNEVRLMAGSLSLSTLVALMNNGESIVRSPAEGPPLFFTGRIVNTDGNAVTGADVDAWHASLAGLCENQDPEQAE